MHWRQEGDRGHSRHQGAEPHHPVIVNPIPSRVARDGHLRTHALPPRACPGGISHVKAFYGQRQKQNSLSPLPPGRGKTPVLQPWSAQHLGAVTQIGQAQQRQAGHQAALVLSWPDREALLGHPPAAKHPHAMQILQGLLGLGCTTRTRSLLQETPSPGEPKIRASLAPA